MIDPDTGRAYCDQQLPKRQNFDSRPCGNPAVASAVVDGVTTHYCRKHVDKAPAWVKKVERKKSNFGDYRCRNA